MYTTVLIWLKKESVRLFMRVHQEKQPIELHRNLEKLDYECFSFSSSIQCSKFSTKHEKPLRIITVRQIFKTPNPKVERNKQKEVKLTKNI